MAMPQLQPPPLRSSVYELDRSDSRPIDVLIADDEPIVRHLLEMALGSAGLRVVTACDGAEAVRRYYDHAGRVRLVLLDVQMPELNGPQAFAALRESAPHVRVAFMSGGSTEYTVEQLLATGAVAFLQKPFRDLEEIVKRLCKLVTSAAHAE